MLDDISRVVSKWLTGKRSNQIMSVVVEAMTEARQKVRASDSPFKSLARKCIDQAEDAYQEAIYHLKDGEPQLCFQYCKQGLKFLSMAMLHLTDVKERSQELEFDEQDPEISIIDLSASIARFKTSVEYTNCEVPSDLKERLIEVVHLYFESVELIKNGETDSASRNSQGGLLFMYRLGRELEDKLQATIVDQAALGRCRGSAATRIVELIDRFSETRKLLLEASLTAQGRIKLYMDAARRTTDRCINAFIDGESDDIGQLAKAGNMELRMANRLIEYAKYPGSGPEPEDEELDEELEDEAMDFKQKVARLQRLLQDRDQEAAVVRRLSVVSSYFSRAQNLLANGDYIEAERYARSAHLDIDFARQLLLDKQAIYSDLI